MKTKFKLSPQHIALIAIILIACAVRIYALTWAPGGLNQDEASAGYEAFSLLNWGIDRNGIKNPVHLLAWGSGQNAAYSWLCMPFVAVFGLSVAAVRLPMAIIGCISVFAFYVFAKQLWDENFALVSALFFAVYPWHIMKSRWGLESNLFPDLVLWGCVLLLLYIKKQKPFYLYGAVLLLSFALYSYGTAYMFMPFFVGGMWIYMLCKKKITAKHFVLSALLFFVTALPIIMFVVINITDLEQFSVLGFTIPKMYQQRFSTVTGTGENFFVGCIGNLKDFISILINQTDGLPWNGFAKYGVCYLVFVPLILVGIIISAVQKSEYSFIVHWWAVCALLVVMVSEVNVNRVNIIFIPIAYYISLALYTIAKQHKYIKIAVICVCICLFGLFCKNYFNQHTSVISYCFFHSYEEALDYAESFDSEKIYVSASINQPYMLTLFYTQTDPYTYLETRHVSNAKTAFETIDSFDKYYFCLPAEISAGEDAVYIVNRDDTAAFDPQYFETENFRYYTVVYGKN